MSVNESLGVTPWPRFSLSNMDGSWIPLTPRLKKGTASWRLFSSCVRALSRIEPAERTFGVAVRSLRERVNSRIGAKAQVLRVLVSALCDLKVQGWSFRITRNGCWARHPARVLNSPADEKARVRAGHLIERDGQLATDTTRQFIVDMERQRLGVGGWASIYSLMRDGRELAKALRAISQLPVEERPQALRRVIDPYVQVVEPGLNCSLTGLRLTDIWRYFRHSWTSAYKSTPGRKVWLLFRDRAVVNHPVIGIAALGSAVVQLGPRDRWIGWTSRDYLAQLDAKVTTKEAGWAMSALSTLIRSVYVRDLISDRVIKRTEIAAPTPTTISRLLREAQAARNSHRLYPSAAAHKSATARPESVNWVRLTKSDLFRSKRSRALAELLTARMHFRRVGFTKSTREGLQKALADRNGRRAIEVILRQVKAAHVGINMLDVIVCGAIAPYNVLLGGKLVSLLTASPEVVAAYESRYARTPSLIASAMAGKAIRRKPRLVLLCTTSLYGVGSSQYNRLRVPSQDVGARPDSELRFEELGRTTGFGSYHFSTATVEEMKLLVAQDSNGRRVNSIFGEGVNPHLRMVREALDVVGLPSDALLRHGSPRLVYGVALATNFRDVLLGRSTRKRVILPRLSSGAMTDKLVDHWVRRWLSRRIERSEVLDEVERHSLAFPVQHGARVVLPPTSEGEGQTDIPPLACGIVRGPRAFVPLGSESSLSWATPG